MWGFVIVLAGAVALAGEKHDKLVLSAERDEYGFQVQQAVIYDDERVAVVRNSNLLCPPSDEVLLGAFHRPHDAASRAERDYVAEIAARLPKTAGGGKKSGNASPHGVRLFIGAHDVTSERDNAAAVDRIVSAACSDPEPTLAGGWIADRGALITREHGKGGDVLKITELEGGSRGKTQTLTFKEAGCRRKGKTRWDCTLARHGLVTFSGKP